MENLVKRFLESIFGNRWDISGEDDLTLKARALLNKLQEADDNTLYWEDVPLEQPDLSGWKTLLHIQRLIDIIYGLGLKHLQEEKETRDKVLRALAWWTNRDFIHPNWWWNEIGLPHRLARIVIPLNQYLADDLREGILRILRRGSMSHNQRIEYQWGGANLTWGVWGTIHYALFENDEELLKRAVNRFAREIYIASGDAEGIKQDLSFHQHGAMLQSGGYGRAFCEAVSDLVLLLTNTPYQLPQDKLDLFCEFVLYGQRYFTHKDGQDYLTVGREISRRGVPRSNLREVVAKLLKVKEMTRKQELQAYYDSLLRDENILEDTRYFPDSLVLTHHRKGFYMSAKGSNTKIMGTECANFENYLAYNHFFGSCTCYMAFGDEYYEINPLWDHCFYPGTTAFVETDDDLLKHTSSYQSWFRMYGTNDHCGGFSDGKYGALYQLMSHDGLSVYMSFIAFDLGMIVLGAGLTVESQDNTKEVVTTIDQCFLKENCYNGNKLEPNMIINDQKALCNGGFAYYNLCEKPLYLFADKVTGNWIRNNRSYGDVLVQGEIFKLWYNHGIHPQNESFAYAVIGKSDTLPEDAQGLPIKKIINTKTIQGVEFTDGHIVLVFHTPGRYETTDGRIISSSIGVVII